MLKRLIDRSPTLCVILVLCATSLANAAVDDVTIQNDLVTLRVAGDGNSFELSRPRGGPAFATAGTFAQKGGKLQLADIVNGFGPGRSIVILRPDGTRDELAVFPKLPFVFVTSTLANPAKEPAVIERVAPIDFAVAAPLEKLRVLGTGGLARPAEAAGSYMWIAAADPATRAGMVAGWITSERGSGVLLPRVENNQLRLRAQVDYGKLRLKPGETQRTETLAIGCFDDARLGLEAWADAVAKMYDIRLPPEPSGYCTWYHAGASNASKLAEQTDFAAKHLKPYGLSFIQIDDGWQDGQKLNGPRKNFSRVRPGGPYPAMKPTADMVRGHEMTPGLWFMPFAGTFDDPWFKEHQDWFARRGDGGGKPYDVRWGGTALDMTHPEARKYVADNVARITHDWGFNYLKMDGLWMGSATELEYVNDAYKDDHLGNAVFHDPEKTNVEAFRSGLKLVREAAGPGVFLLGCNGPQNMRSYGGAFGLLDAMRIGPDNGPAWASLLRGPTFGSRHYHLNGRIWWNDPDPLYVRASVPTSHARLICSWIAVSGQLAVASDEFAKLPPDQLDLLKRTMPSHPFPARPVDLFDRALPRIWIVSDEKGPAKRHVVGLFNWDSAAVEIDEPLERLGLTADKEYAAFDYWTNALLPPVKQSLRMKLNAAVSGKGKDAKATDAENACAVLAVRELADHPVAIGTSRHITQGMMDLTAETWDAATGTLSGTSQVVGGDGYEVRVLARSTRGPWKLLGAEVSAEDKAAGASVEAVADGEIVRVKVNSEKSRGVKWSVRTARMGQSKD